MVRRRRFGIANNLYLWLLAFAVTFGLLSYLLFRGSRPADPQAGKPHDLFLFCAAGLRYPMDTIVDRYGTKYGVSVQIQYGGSNTLLNQLEVARTGDLYLAADEQCVRLAREKGLIAEVIPLATQRPVIVVAMSNPKGIASLEDLLRSDVKVALGNPEGPAIGQMTQRLLAASGHWERLKTHVTRRGVFKPTVNDIANDVKLGAVDAGVVWDATAAAYPELAAVHVPEFDAGVATVEIAVLNSSRDPTAALRFARFVGASDEGLEVFRKHAFQVVEGDPWEELPEITLFSGSVNRRTMEPIVAEFEKREGVRVNTVFNGCGILTAQMRTAKGNQGKGFPDTYLACDVHYLEPVKDWFQESVIVSDTDIVIVVQKGNPKGIRQLSDLLRPGIRVAIGHPDQCTIGVLTREWFQKEGIYDELLKSNVVTQTATSALLVPSVTTGAADAALVYATDTLGDPQRLDVVRIPSSLAKAYQPFSIARSSKFKELSRRLFQHISRSRALYESKGFNWRLDSSPAERSPAVHREGAQ